MDPEILDKLEEMIDKQNTSIDKLTDIIVQLQSTLTVNADLVAQTLSNLTVNIKAQDLAEIIIAQSAAPSMQVLPSLFSGGTLNNDLDYETDDDTNWSIRTNRGAKTTDSGDKQTGTKSIKWTLGTDTTKDQYLPLAMPDDIKWSEIVKIVFDFKIANLPVADGDRSLDQAIELILSSEGIEPAVTLEELTTITETTGRTPDRWDQHPGVYDGTNHIYIGCGQDLTTENASMYKVNLTTYAVTEIELPVSGYDSCRNLIKVGTAIYFSLHDQSITTCKLCKLSLADDSITVIETVTDYTIVHTAAYDGSRYIYYGLCAPLNNYPFKIYKLDTSTDTIADSWVSSLNIARTVYFAYVGGWLYGYVDDYGSSCTALLRAWKMECATKTETDLGFLNTVNPEGHQEYQGSGSVFAIGTDVYFAAPSAYSVYRVCDGSIVHNHLYKIDTTTDTISVVAHNNDANYGTFQFIYDGYDGIYFPTRRHQAAANGKIEFMNVTRTDADTAFEAIINTDVGVETLCPLCVVGNYLYLTTKRRDTSGDCKFYRIPIVPLGYKEYFGNDVNSIGAATWGEVTLLKADFSLLSATVDTDHLDNLIFRIRKGQFTAGSIVRIDSMKIYTGSDTYVPERGDVDGHAQVDILTLPSLVDGTATIGKVDLNPLSGIGGHNQTTVGATAVQLPASACKSVSIKAMSTNTGIIYVGKDTNVTTGNGYELKKSEPLVLDVDNVDDVWCIASAADQKVCWITVT